MSEICGLLHFDGNAPSDSAQLEAVSTHLARPFSADWGGFEAPGIRLKQLLFAQTPESAELHRCVELPEAGLALAARLRLDNREELQESLGLPAESASWPDEIYVLKAFEKWGPDAFKRLLGDFALALWDARSQALYLVRDALGVAPLYYFQRDGFLCFASGMAALRQHAEAPTAPDDRQIAKFLILDLDSSENTFLDEIKRVQAGHYLCVRNGAVHTHCYYRLEAGPAITLKARDYEQRFRELLISAVTSRLRSPHAPSFLLSGGLDSSALVGIARDAGSKPIHTYSGLFPDYPEIDERDWIDKILAEGDYDAHFHRMDRESPLASLSRDVRLQGQPYYAPNNYVDRAMLDRAEADGRHLLLDGLDGDTTVGHGWEYLGQLLREGRLRRLYRQLRDLGRHTNRASAWFLWTHALLPTAVALHARLWANRRSQVAAFINPEFARQTNLRELLIEKNETLYANALRPFREQHLNNLSSGLIPRSFELAQEQAHARGIIRRHPYFDLRLVEFCVSLPPEQRLDRGLDRLIQRRAVGGLVPEAIRQRVSKSVWELNTRERFLQDDRPLIEAAGELFRGEAQRYLSPDVLAQLVNHSNPLAPKTDTVLQFWIAYCLSVWFRPT